MYRYFILAIIVILTACGQKPESDIVGTNDRSFQYIFQQNPLYSLDTTYKKTSATLSLYSALPGHTQFSVLIDRIHKGKSYLVGIYDEDTTTLSQLAPTARLTFPVINSVDTAELAYSPLTLWDMDSIINHYQGYLVLYHAGDTILTDANMLIKGKIGKH